MSGWSIISAHEAAPEPLPVSAERAALLGIAPAPIGRRMIASVIDALPAILFAAPLWFTVPPAIAGELWGILVSAICVLLLIVYAIIQLASHGRRGQTFGKQMMRLRTLRHDTLKPIGFGRALLRAILVAASNVVPVVGPAILLGSPLWDAEHRRRGWHDHAVRGWLIDLDAVDPTDPVAFESARGRARVRSVAAASAVPAAAAPVAPAASERVAAEPPAPVVERIAPAAAPAAPAAPAPAAPAPVAHVRFDTGDVVAIHGPALVGRGPVAGADEIVMHLLPIADDTRSISKTHFALVVDAHGLVLVDRGSTNGTGIERAGQLTPAAPGAPVRVVAGDRIRFGDRTADVLA